MIEIYLFFIDSFTLSQLFFVLLGNAMLFAIIYMTKELRDLNSNFLVAENKEQFKKLIIEQIQNPYNTKALKDFASNYSWVTISQQYQKFIKSIIKK